MIGILVWWLGGEAVYSYVDSPCVNNKFALCGLPLCQQQICLNEEIDAYLCTSSRLSSELRLCDIYAGRVFKTS